MKEKQIEEMARTICEPTANKGNCEKCGFKKKCSKFDDATALYNAGYRKQIEGEWVDKRAGAYNRMQSWCSACGKHSGIGGIESNRHKPFCPNCGASMVKMKGENNAKIFMKEAPTVDLVPRSEWISVEDRLPSKEELERSQFHNFLTANEFGEVREAVFTGEYFAKLGSCLSGVTHWMPLPEPPKMKD